MRSSLYLSLYVTALLMPVSAAAEGNFQLEAMRRKLGSSDNAIIIQPAQITLIGQITPAIAVAFKNAMNQEKNIKVVLVDSSGGDMESALNIAMIIKNRKLNLVVDGRCFSACANYLFPAAQTKIVLPGSFVAIHETTVLYPENGSIKWTLNVEEAERTLRAVSDKPALEKLMQLRMKEKIFVEQLEINAKLHNSYAIYLLNRKNSFGSENLNFESSYPNCPPVKMWILNKQQLISMGIKGIGDFWFPRNDEEKKMLSTYFKFPPGSAFYGEAHDLELVCKNTTNNWFSRRLYDAKSFILSTLPFLTAN
jgi:ATP-dependent protease ClpP protease subunit